MATQKKKQAAKQSSVVPITEPHAVKEDSPPAVAQDSPRTLSNIETDLQLASIRLNALLHALNLLFCLYEDYQFSGDFTYDDFNTIWELVYVMEDYAKEIDALADELEIFPHRCTCATVTHERSIPHGHKDSHEDSPTD